MPTPRSRSGRRGIPSTVIGVWCTTRIQNRVVTRKANSPPYNAATKAGPESGFATSTTPASCSTTSGTATTIWATTYTMKASHQDHVARGNGGSPTQLWPPASDQDGGGGIGGGGIGGGGSALMKEPS